MTASARRMVRVARRRDGVTAGGMIALLLLAGCTNDTSSPTSGPPVVGGTVKLSTAAEIASFHPYSATGASNASFFYDSLVNVNATGDVVSGLADKWAVTSTTATFTLRRGVTCADGTALTAKDVADSLTYASDPKNQLTGAQVFLPSVPFTASADAAAGTVSVQLSSPFSFITQTVGVVPIVCPAGLKDPTSLDRASTGTGPYVLSSYSPSGPYVFTVRTGYSWGPNGATTAEPGTPAKIELSVVATPATVTNLLLGGALNLAQINGPDIARVQGRELFSLDAPVVLGFSGFNHRSGHPTSDPVVRKALIAALDRQQLANVIAGGAGTPAEGLSAKNAVCHADIASVNLPHGDAAHMLEAGGWTAGSGGIREKDGKPLRIRLITSPFFGSTYPATAELIASMWTSVGVDTQLISEDQNALVNDLFQKSNFDFVLGTSAGYLPSNLVTTFSGPTPPEGLNITGVNNADYTRLVNQALRETGQASCATWNEAEAALLRDADVLPIADGTVKYFGNKVTFALGQALQFIPTSIRLHK